MKTLTTLIPLKHKRRRGAIALMVALLLTAIIGLIACAFDIGWIVLTRTQLQVVADSSSLAGGTELMPGLGLFATKTPSEVAADARPVAVEYAARNPNGNLSASFVDPDRDVNFGKAVFDADGCGCWQKSAAADSPYYNYVEVTAHRDQGGAAGGDGNLPLFFARILGMNDLPLAAMATAVILPANGFRVNPGSEDTAEVMPFAFSKEMWDRFKRAKEYYDDYPDVFSDPTALADILDPEATDAIDNRLFGVREQSPDGSYTFKQLFYDNYTVTDGVVSLSGVPDGILEVDIYPHPIAEGNFGTVDFGAGSNSTSDLVRQITEGLNEDDLSYYDNSQIVLTEDDPLDAEGDTGISGGIESALQSVKGECKAIALFTATDDGTGNNLVYTLTEFVSVTVVDVQLSGSTTNKKLIMQRCVLVDDNAIGDVEGEIGVDTTIFTPLILVE